MNTKLAPYFIVGVTVTSFSKQRGQLIRGQWA
jgi:hypothetical protein